ncbi:MAG: redoxin domain-containing protein [Pirellulales bacterium]
MARRNRGLAWAALLLGTWMTASCATGLLRAEEVAPANQPGPSPGHSVHGEAYNEGPRQRAHLMPGTGKVHLAITTNSPEAQKFFDQGLGQLHGFWYFEAERSFREAATLDPDCAMAYWGLALSNVSNLTRGRPFIAQAVERKAKVTRHEALWIEALDAYYKPEGEDKHRRKQSIRAMENILYEFPDDLEAKAFLVWQIWDNNSHKLELSSHLGVDSLISEILAVEPMHPVHHYRIHLWDGEKPARALASAALCGQSAPSTAHMWHMPGHIFSGLQRYADAAWQQEAATRVDHAYMIRDRVLPDQIHNYAHNSEWLIRDLIYLGRVRDALDLARNLIEMPRHPKYNVLSGNDSARFGRTRLYDVLLEYELWDDLLADSQNGYLQPTEEHEDQVKRLRQMAVAWHHKGEGCRCDGILARLEQMLAKEQAEQQQAGDEAEKKAREEGKNDEEATKAKNDAINSKAGRVNPLTTATAELRGLKALAAADYPAAFAEFDKSNKLREEFLARARLLAGENDKAEEIARRAVNNGRNQVLPLATLVEVLHRCGKPDEARQQFEELRKLAAQAELALPPFERLAPIAAEFGYPADWRLPLVVAEDVGQRPDLATLGPYRWHPTPAIEWKLADSAGTMRSLAEYRGRPVVLLFYLGHGCVHCVDQLKEFTRLQDRYRAAGIELLAISTDSSQALSDSLNSGIEGGPQFTFLAADAEQQVFRDYRAYDEFENQPLHGTFLIDGEGLVRWHDTGFEPFMDGEFLLTEAQRLLTLGQPQPEPTPTEVVPVETAPAAAEAAPAAAAETAPAESAPPAATEAPAEAAPAIPAPAADKP